MKRMVLILTAFAWTLALAQTPPGEDQAPGTEVPEEPVPAPVESEAEEPEEEPEEELTEEEKAAKAMADEDFKPGDEISEDYPIPLPADI